jgi:hypothetical protein
MRAEQAEPAHIGGDLDGKHRLLVPLLDVGPDAVADERPDRVAPGEFLG